MSGNNNLLKLFQRPFEPSFFPKDDGKTVFNIPSDYFTERYESSGAEIQSRFGEDDIVERVAIENIPPPDIKFAMAIPQKGAFSLFNENHRQIAGDLIQLFMDQPTTDRLLSVAVYCKDRLNAYLFQYALSVAIYHRKDTENDIVPSIVEIFPDQFFDPAVFPTLREEGHLPETNRIEVEIPRNYTASDEEPEQRVAYFREDIGVNAHHWHWHLVYPGRGPESVVNKDRRGELFFEMHSQLIARYNIERMCAGLPLVKPLSNLREPIPEAYFPKLLRTVNNRTYSARAANSSLSDLNRQELKTSLANMERWRDRVLEAVDSGFATDKQGNRIKLDEEKGIDILGNMLESSILSINPDYYGSFHNHFHSIIGYIHDPDGRHLEDYGVAGDVTTAMRDPAFYRLHAYCDDIWLMHKNKLPQYPNEKLEYDDVTVDSVDLQITKGNRIPAPNTMLTFWQKSSVNLGSGLDFGKGNVFVSFTHLQYAPFNYRIIVTNSSEAQKMGTCRIYCCPKYKKGNIPMDFEEKRYLMIEMDKFTVTLKPGQNTIIRRSDESSITIPFERTFKQQGKADDLSEEFRFCGCGWPQHMLLPKGTAQGMVFEFIVQISNFKDDIVDGPIDPSNCGEAHSYCGLRNKKYPDKRSMGYPFDRVHPTTDTLEDFLDEYTNFASQDVSIRFVDRVLQME